MSTPSVFDLCQPRADVLAGNIAEADFAADLASVIAGGGNEEYRDPVRFFANTYPTRGLRNLLANVCGRLSGSGSEVAAIFRLDTSYGGGKTHGLIALAHAARGMDGVADVAEFVDPALPILMVTMCSSRPSGAASNRGRISTRGDLLFGPGDPATSIAIDEQAVVFTMLHAKNGGIWSRPQPRRPDPARETGDDTPTGDGADTPDSGRERVENQSAGRSGGASTRPARRLPSRERAVRPADRRERIATQPERRPPNRKRSAPRPAMSCASSATARQAAATKSGSFHRRRRHRSPRPSASRDCAAATWI